MLKAATYALQAMTILALLCASVIRARTLCSASPREGVPATHLGQRTATPSWIADAWSWERTMPVHKEESHHRTFVLLPVHGHRTIEVNNVLGSIEVLGSSDDTVQMDVDKSLYAESDQALERAQKDIALDVEQIPGVLKIEVHHPSRCALPDCGQFDTPSYAVETNLRLQTPRDSDLTLKAVDGGEVRVRDVSGVFSVSNAHGAVRYFRTRSVAAGRVSRGGSLIRVENLDGDVRILERHD
jgi:hypothetical protein